MNLLITGASGLVATELIFSLLKNKDYHLTLLSRNTDEIFDRYGHYHNQIESITIEEAYQRIPYPKYDCVQDDFSIYKNDANKFFNSRHWDIIIESLHSLTNSDSNLWICFRNYLDTRDSEYKIRDMYVQNIYKLLKYKIFPIILPDLSDIRIDSDKFSFYEEKDYDKLEMFYNKDNLLFKRNPNIENLRSYLQIDYIPNEFSFRFIKESKFLDSILRNYS